MNKYRNHNVIIFPRQVQENHFRPKLQWCKPAEEQTGSNLTSNATTKTNYHHCHCNYYHYDYMCIVNIIDVTIIYIYIYVYIHM